MLHNLVLVLSRKKRLKCEIMKIILSVKFKLQNFDHANANSYEWAIIVGIGTALNYDDFVMIEIRSMATFVAFINLT